MTTQEQVFLTDDILQDELNSYIDRTNEMPEIVTMNQTSLDDILLASQITYAETEMQYRGIQVVVDDSLVDHEFRLW